MQTPAGTLLQEGLKLHRLGRLADAERLYRAVLASDPGNADAYYYLAALACQRGCFSEGAELARNAIAIDAGQARAHKLLGIALHQLGQNDEALAALDAALTRDPNFAEAYGVRGDVLTALGRLIDAVDSYDRALAIDPTAVANWCNRGATLSDLGRYGEAVANFDRLIALQPQFAGAYYNRGDALAQLDRYEEALADYDHALALHQNSADVYNNRAIVLRKLGRENEALASLERALAINPNHMPALVMRANILVKHTRYKEALTICDHVLARKPDEFNVHVTRGEALAGLGRLQESIASADAALAINPDHAVTKWNKSLSLLSLGRFAEGWPLYKNRWAMSRDLVRRNYLQPSWDGGYCRGTLLIWGEQGLGDQILYAGIIEDAERHADTIVFEVEPRLVPLFARSFPNVRVVGYDPKAPDTLYSGDVDAQIALADLGGFFRTGWEAFPRRKHGYLIADRARAEALRDRLSRGCRTIIGLSWRSVNAKIGASKTAALGNFEALLRMPNCRFVDLQYGDTRDERMEIERQFGVRVEHLDDIDNTNDIDGLAALIMACDVVVTVSNTTAHLAGAVGTPTWVLVPYGHGRLWYWFQDRSDSPWYPRVHVRRQNPEQSWADLINAIMPELAAALA